MRTWPLDLPIYRKNQKISHGKSQGSESGEDEIKVNKITGHEPQDKHQCLAKSAMDGPPTRCHDTRSWRQGEKEHT